MGYSQHNKLCGGVCRYGFVGLIIAFFCSAAGLVAQTNPKGLHATVSTVNGSYSVGTRGKGDVFTSDIAAEVNGHWLQSKNYPHHAVTASTTQDDLGTADQWTVTFSGLPNEPDLSYTLHAYPDRPYADIQVIVQNTTAKPIEVEAIRSIEAVGSPKLNLNGPALEDRVLSDSFSENRPAIKIRDLADAVDNMHLGVGSQLIYNRKSGLGYFVGALTSDRFLTVLRIHTSKAKGQEPITAYEADSTGTTELEKQYALKSSGPQNWVPLRVKVQPGENLPSEKLLIGVSREYHRQLDTYGALIRRLHHARVSAANPMGWWSWTAYYFGLNQGTALTNAQWLAQHLKSLGYDFFHIDEGYQYARGDYTTPNATLFPNGMVHLEWKIRGLGLIPGLWTAPFDVSNRSSIYQNHRDWLVHNLQGEPIQAGAIANNQEKLFILDPTNPGAQQYLRKTYSTLVNEWGIRYIKLDFMDDTAAEGVYYRPNMTAMEAQRIGLKVIREAVGDHVLLDKDGSPMLNPVGFVDFGRISQDTRHSYAAIKTDAPGIAARYYMNRNFFVSDPDAFTISSQKVSDHTWPKGMPALTLDEAKSSIALAAVSGGMFEIGDDLPTLGSEPKRLALVQNKDLIAMVQQGRASVPEDLMTFAPQDEQPSIFYLKEDQRQSILTIFDWTDQPRTHTIQLADFGLATGHKYRIWDVLDTQDVGYNGTGSLIVSQPAHSVRMLKIIDESVPATAPDFAIQRPSEAKAGQTVQFEVNSTNPNVGISSYRWDCGDGITLQGRQIHHAYTGAGSYTVAVTATGLDGPSKTETFVLPVTGTIQTTFVPSENTKYEPIH